MKNSVNEKRLTDYTKSLYKCLLCAYFVCPTVQKHTRNSEKQELRHLRRWSQQMFASFEQISVKSLTRKSTVWLLLSRRMKSWLSVCVSRKQKSMKMKRVVCSCEQLCPGSVCVWTRWGQMFNATEKLTQSLARCDTANLAFAQVRLSVRTSRQSWADGKDVATQSTESPHRYCQSLPSGPLP